MKIFKKYFIFLSIVLILDFINFLPFRLIISGIDDTQVEKIGNFLDNAFANMNDEEKDIFMQEVQREQEKLMAMSPEERAAREEQVARELDQLMNNSPYGEWFDKPLSSTIMPEPVQSTEESKIVPKEEKTNTQPIKKTVIPKDLKDQYKQIVQKIVMAIDAILLKTNNMQQVQHVSWNNSKWYNLKHDLQILKSQLQIAINSDKILTNLVDKNQKTLILELQKFENLITASASQIKTPDAMGLIVIFEGQPKIIDQDRYNSSIIKLKSVIESLSKELSQNNLVSKIQALLDNNTITNTNSKVINESKLAHKKNKPDIKAVNNCKSTVTQDSLLNDIKNTTKEIKRCVNQALLDLAFQYQNNPSNSLKRKLQWKLSELELYMQKLAKNIEALTSSNANCRSDVDKILNENLQNYGFINKLITVLNNINATSELKHLIKQINHHATIIKF